MNHRKWGPTVCLDCRATCSGYCDTCTQARKAAGVREVKDRDAHNAYQRAYRAKAQVHPIQGPKLRNGCRERVKRYRERKKNKGSPPDAP